VLSVCLSGGRWSAPSGARYGRLALLDGHLVRIGATTWCCACIDQDKVALAGVERAVRVFVIVSRSANLAGQGIATCVLVNQGIPVGAGWQVIESQSYVRYTAQVQRVVILHIHLAEGTTASSAHYGIPALSS